MNSYYAESGLIFMIITKCVKDTYYHNIKVEALKRITLQLDSELKSEILYFAMSAAVRGLEIYLMNNTPDTLLEYLLERLEKDTLRYCNIPFLYLWEDKQHLYVIDYNNNILEEISEWEKTLTRKEVIHILTEVLNIELSSHEVIELYIYIR